MNIIVPIGGANKVSAETEYIKSLQEIEQKTILQYVFESLQSIEADHFIVVIKREDANIYHLDSIVKLLRPGTEVIIAEGETMGAACTCMLAADKLDMDKPLLITGSDQLLMAPPEEILEYFFQKDYDSGVVIFDDIHPRWSYVKLDASGLVVEAAEKRPISRNATAGFYFFKKARYFFDAAKRMILKNADVNGKFYICPVLNEMILQQQTVGVFPIDKSQYFKFNHASGIEAYKNYLKNQGDLYENRAN